MRRNFIPNLLVLGAVTVAMTACGGGNAADVQIPPLVTSVVPASGGVVGGTPITINGSGFTNQTIGITEVLVGGLPADKVVVVSASRITCETPPGAQGPADVSVTKNGGTGTLANGYTFYPPPTLASIDPNRGTRFGGQTGTLTGTGFVNNEPGETLIAFGGKPVPFFSILGDNVAELTTPTVFVEGPVDVFLRNANGSDTLINGYTYGGPPPTITSLTPGNGPLGGGTEVTIIGSGFTQAAGTTNVVFGGISGVGVTRVDDFTIVCFTPARSAPGFVDVEVSNTNGSDTLVNGFEYNVPPEITSIDPTEGPEAGGTPITITGTGFEDDSLSIPIVLFGGVPASNVALVSDTEVTCDTPPGSTGFVTITLQNDNGLGTLVDGFEYVGGSCEWDSSFGTSVTLGDDATANRSWSSFSFDFLGTTYTSVWIGSNGSITFGSGTTNLSSTSLLGRPQISLVQTDLNPRSAGTVYHKEESDRSVITYSGVPSFGSSNSNTMQAILHANGTVCMMWENVDDTSHYVAIGSGGSQQTVTFQNEPSSTSSSSTMYEFMSTSQVEGFIMKCTVRTSGGFDTEVTPLP